MTMPRGTELAEHLAPVARPERVGQGTAVEQSRAVAQVLAAVQVARQYPRDLASVKAEMVEACRVFELADQAFFSVPRGNQRAEGASIHLARELARIWGNIDHGVSELRRDDVAGESEMMAQAWDLQTNVKSSHTFIVPHAMDLTGGGRKHLVQLQGIYENNANNSARRLREAIFSVLPRWYVDAAKAECRKTLKRGNGEPLADRIGKALGLFAGIGVEQVRVERRVGRPLAEWTVDDVAALGIDFRTLQRKEATVDQLFPIAVDGAALIAEDPPAPAGPSLVDQLAGEQPDRDPAEPPPDDPMWQNAPPNAGSAQ